MSSTEVALRYSYGGVRAGKCCLKVVGITRRLDTGLVWFLGQCVEEYASCRVFWLCNDPTTGRNRGFGRYLRRDGGMEYSSSGAKRKGLVTRPPRRSNVPLTGHICAASIACHRSQQHYELFNSRRAMPIKSGYAESKYQRGLTLSPSGPQYPIPGLVHCFIQSQNTDIDHLYGNRSTKNLRELMWHDELLVNLDSQQPLSALTYGHSSYSRRQREYC